MAMSERLENNLVRLLHGGVFAVAAWSILTVDFTGHGRLIDKLRGAPKQEAVTQTALSAPQKAKLAGAGSTDRLMAVAGETAQQPAHEQNRALTAAELAAQVPDLAGSNGQAGPKRLKSKLAALDDPSRMASQQTSAAAEAQPAYIEASAVSAPTATGVTYSFEPPAEDQPKARAIASRYSTGRSDMMGRAAGPVYNIKGKKK